MLSEIKLANNFWLSEFTKSSTATRLGIDNSPTEEQIEKLRYLSNSILQPTRDYFVTETKKGKLIKITSGYRCLELNRELGSSDSSQHVLAEAVDFEVPRVDNYEVACWIRDNLEFDQLILEFYEGGNTGWIHVSKVENGHNRNECLTINKGIIKRGLKR